MLGARPALRVLLAGALAAAALAGTAAPSSALTAAGVGSGPQPVLLTGSGWTVATDSAGTILRWDPSGRALTGDARPEFALDGEVLGAPVSDRTGGLRLFVPGLRGVTPARLSVLLAGRRIDGGSVRGRAAATTRPAGTTTATAKARAAATGPTRPAALLTPDPGAKGRFATTSYRYAAPSITVDGMAVPLEVLGKVVAPVGAPGRRPLVLLLHGRHSTCYLGKETSIDWPCVGGFRPIPSLAGYGAIQRLLASRGYVTVSIAANAVNAQDGELQDSGANARSVLVRHHLGLLAAWSSRGGGPTGTSALRGRLDMRKVLLVGHSRGGEGVARAAIDARASDPFRVRGEVLIAPTDFGRQVAAGVPTTVLLPYCDGDVSDLQGQQYVDQARGLVTGDRALLTAAMVLGANHNYFNSEWTPGVAAAPADDDWGDTSDSACAPGARGRLTARAQRAVGATYVSAAAATYLRGSRTAVRLLDGTAVRAASTGAAVVLTEAIGGKRRALLTDPRPTARSATGRAATSVCAGFSLDGGPSCLGDVAPSPHWLQGYVPTTYALSASWRAAGGVMRARLPAPRDLSASRHLDLRLIADPRIASSRFRVVLTDSRGRTAAAPATTLRALVGSASSRKAWAQTVRLPLTTFRGVDLRSIRAIAVRAVSTTGHLYLLDAYGSRTGAAATSVAPTSVPRFEVTSTSVTLPADDQVHEVPVTVRVSGDVVRPARLLLAVQGAGGAPGKVQVRELADGVSELTVAPGTREVTFTIRALGSSVFSSEPDRVSVLVYAARDAQVSGYVGGAEVRSDVPAPTLSVARPDIDVVQGRPMIWVLSLSAAARYGWYDMALAVQPSSGTELTVADLLPVWVRDRAQTPTLPDGSPAPLSQAELNLPIGTDMLVTTSILEIPTARTSSTTGDRTVSLEIQPDGIVVLAPLRLTAVVHPAP